MTKPPVLTIEHLTVSRHGELLLRDISLALHRDECLAIVGPNGAGKSTLLKTIAGIVPHYDGSVLVGGNEVRELSPQVLAHRVGFVPQRIEHLPPFSVREFLELSGLERSEESLSLVRHLEDRSLTHLSGGELQRALVAGVVAQGASMLLLDEPTSNVDPRGRKEIEQLLKKCRDELSLSYILVTHDVSLALRSADRIAIMNEGAVEWCGPQTDPMLVSRLSRAYQCEFVELHHERLSTPFVVSS